MNDSNLTSSLPPAYCGPSGIDEYQTKKKIKQQQHQVEVHHYQHQAAIHSNSVACSSCSTKLEGNEKEASETQQSDKTTVTIIPLKSLSANVQCSELCSSILCENNDNDDDDDQAKEGGRS